MELYLKGKRKGYSAKAIYDTERKAFIILKGSIVPSDVAQSEKFRGAKSIIVARDKFVIDCVVKEDVVFKSSSTAANFITGRSTNGMISWKDKNGVKLKDLLDKA